MNTETREIELVKAARIAGFEFASEKNKLFAFLSIFEPQLSLEEKLDIVKNSNSQ